MFIKLRTWWHANYCIINFYRAVAPMARYCFNMPSILDNSSLEN
jgi:hypothetical protein